MIYTENYGAACAAITVDGFRIVCDPWFSEPVYLGAWQRENYIPDPLTVIGPCDYVYISHLHEDHYDPDFLRYYLASYPTAKLWVSTHCKHLIRLTAEFKPLIANSLSIGPWIAAIIPNHGYEANCNIDTALVVTDATHAVVNMNDNPLDQSQVDRINAMTAGKHVTALLPYTGAGPWPQCYKMTHHELYLAMKTKERKFLAQFAAYSTALHADIAVPFSAGYQLRGPLAELNAYRGIPRVEDVPGATVLPVIGEAKRPDMPFTGYDWSNDATPTNMDIELLLIKAGDSAPKMSGDPLTIELDWGTGSAYVDCTHASAPRAHETLLIDSRLLLRLLDGRAHWNTFEISSVARIIRHGEQYDSRVFDYLNRFHARLSTNPSPPLQNSLANEKDSVYVRTSN